MPLLDHSHPPLSRTHPWRAFHGAWAAAMARLLNAGVLKDRPRARQAFTAKCAGHLRRGCGVVVDAVTTTRADLLAELLDALDAESPGCDAGSLSATAYRPVGGDGEGQLQIWPAELEVGRPLPTVPLWLGAEPAVPLDLEAGHAAACSDLRIREAG